MRTMKYPIIFFSMVVIVVAGFVLMFTGFNSAPQRLNEVAVVEDIDECYDNTMTTWFVEFNQSQEAGATIAEADNKAAEKALSSFEECD